MNGVLDTVQQEEASRSIETEVTREQKYIAFLNGCFFFKKGNKRSRLEDKTSELFITN
jgi:hypothetical protein